MSFTYLYALHAIIICCHLIYYILAIWLGSCHAIVYEYNTVMMIARCTGVGIMQHLLAI